MVSHLVNVSDDKLKAFLTIEPGQGDHITFEDTIKHISDAGIVYGIDEDCIRRIIDQGLWGEKHLIARGQDPIKGNDGAIEYLFETNPTLAPKTNKDGSVNYYDLNLTQSVAAGQELARLILPSGGQDGINVLGEIVPPPSGKPASLVLGKNTSYANSDKSAAKSDIDGSIKLGRSGAIEVEAKFKISSNIDFGTGNVDIKGGLVIQGDIKAGFKVRATGEIEVVGTVEDAEVVTGGNILIKGGFLGDGKGLIKSDNNVILKFIHGQRVETGNDIHVLDESIQADLSAGGSLFVHEGKGVIIGGRAVAAKNAIIKVIGNLQSTKTEIAVAEKSDLSDRMTQIKKDIAKLNAKLEGITDRTTWMLTKKTISRLTSAEENEMRLLEKLSTDLTATVQSLTDEIKGLDDKLREHRAIASIRVTKIVYPGAILRIAGLVKEINDEYGPGEFRVIDGQIIYLK